MADEVPPSASVHGYRARRSAQQAQALARDRLRAVAVDGKTLPQRPPRRRHPGPPPRRRRHGGHLLDHLEVDVKHNETSHYIAVVKKPAAAARPD